MNTNNGSRRQFSLRALLLVVLASGALLGAWRALSTMAFLGLFFFMLCTVPLLILKGPWKFSFVLSWSAVYTPFIVMATYTLLYVDCSHCKATVCMMLPIAPGLIPVEMARRVVDLQRPSDTTSFVFAFLLSAFMVIALAWVLRIGGSWCRALSVAVTLMYCTFAAFATLAMIRA